MGTIFGLHYSFKYDRISQFIKEFFLNGQPDGVSVFCCRRRKNLAKRSKIAQEAFEIAEPVVTGLGFDLVDCSYVKEARGMVLTLYIDKRGGIGIDDCETVSRAVDPIIDESSSIDPDFFEVSSPGLTRPLETEKDYIRYAGEKVDVSLYQPRDGKKSFTAAIKGAEEGKATFVFDNGEELELAFEDIAKAVRHIDF